MSMGKVLVVDDEVYILHILDFSLGADVWGKELDVWRKAGGTHLSMRAMDTAVEAVGGKHVGYSGPQAYIDALRTFRESVDWS